MKAIFSTKYLAAQLDRALKDKSFEKIEFEEKHWLFVRKEKKNIEVAVDYTRSSSRELMSLYIDRAQWLQLLQFLRLLPEQPIVLEISDYGDDVNLRLEQFVADF